MEEKGKASIVSVLELFLLFGSVAIPMNWVLRIILLACMLPLGLYVLAKLKWHVFWKCACFVFLSGLVGWPIIFVWNDHKLSTPAAPPPALGELAKAPVNRPKKIAPKIEEKPMGASNQINAPNSPGSINTIGQVGNNVVNNGPKPYIYNRKFQEVNYIDGENFRTKILLTVARPTPTLTYYEQYPQSITVSKTAEVMNRITLNMDLPDGPGPSADIMFTYITKEKVKEEDFRTLLKEN